MAIKTKALDWHQRNRRLEYRIREPPGREIAATHHARVCSGNTTSTSGYVRVRIKDEGITVSKNEAYDEILFMLVEKTREAVEMYKDSIPAFDLDHFNMFLPVVLENRDSPVPWRKKMHEKDRNKGLDAIAVSVNKRLSRLHGWGGKKIKLV